MTVTEVRTQQSSTRKHSAQLFARWHNDRDQRAREALIREYMPLARSLARRYERSSEPLDDLIQVANLGLVKAIDRFDPDRGPQFAAFAVPTILGEIKRYFRDTSWSVHVPRRAQERALEVEDARQAVSSQTGRTPSVGQLAQFLEISHEEVLAGLQTGGARASISLDAPCGSREEGSQDTLGETIGVEDERFAFVDDAATVGSAMRELDDASRELLRLRFACDLTQSEIADELGISQMQVSRLLRRAIDGLRESCVGCAPGR